MEFCKIWRNGLERMACTNGIKVWIQISHDFGQQYLWTQFRSLPLVRGLSFQKQIIMYCFFYPILNSYLQNPIVDRITPYGRT